MSTVTRKKRAGTVPSLDEFGLYSSVIYGIDDRIEAGLRAGWVSGISEAGLDDRIRLSPSLTWYANEARTVQARLQYNWDHSDDFGERALRLAPARAELRRGARPLVFLNNQLR